MGIIEDESTWLKILDDRNMSVHIYDKETSRQIFKRIKTSYIRKFKNASENIEK